MKPPISLLERPLLIRDEDVAAMREELDPKIHTALRAHGYLEHRSSEERIPIDTSSIFRSRAYIDHLNTNFDALTINTLYDVDGNSKALIDASIDLKKIGGLAAARISKKGTRYSIQLNPSSSDLSNVPAQPLDYYSALDIVEDIQASTMLGRRTPDMLDRNFSNPVSALESLLSQQVVERSNLLQYVDSSSEYADTRASLAETLHVKNNERAAKFGQRVVRRASSLDIITTQDVLGGKMTTGLHYRSSRNHGSKVDIATRLSAEIDSEYYRSPDNDDADLRALIQNTIDQYQDDQDDKFSRLAIATIIKLSDPNFGVIRIA